ncbi:hypothetical protein DPMN_025600 [Dreissena polymorpha]|uniref:Uncharacterized protein n=1 Tax=Dreissena polymorpha TaxID=45954 RepID=A0A9D4LR11_DREPO|nr:hypothetical protein DPMN_025600 [Dreissena polymorpha]
MICIQETGRQANRLTENEPNERRTNMWNSFQDNNSLPIRSQLDLETLRDFIAASTCIIVTSSAKISLVYADVNISTNIGFYPRIEAILCKIRQKLVSEGAQWVDVQEGEEEQPILHRTTTSTSTWQRHDPVSKKAAIFEISLAGKKIRISTNTSRERGRECSGKKISTNSWCVVTSQLDWLGIYPSIEAILGKIRRAN